MNSRCIPPPQIRVVFSRSRLSFVLNACQSVPCNSHINLTVSFSRRNEPCQRGYQLISLMPLLDVLLFQFLCWERRRLGNKTLKDFFLFSFFFFGGEGGYKHFYNVNVSREILQVEFVILSHVLCCKFLRSEFWNVMKAWKIFLFKI